tara:strand:- start:3462 stop:4706 length:1245 start_codon:yes stop_codon:yes gene_type:complete
MKFKFIFITIILFFFQTLRLVFAIDFFEIHNPKFIPVKVGLVKNSKPEVEAIQNVFKENLEKIIYFKIIQGSKEEFEKNKEVVFVIEIELNKDLKKLSTSLWSPEKNVPFTAFYDLVDEVIDLRKHGLKISDWFVEKTLKFKGVSESLISYTSQKLNRRKNIMLSSYDGTVQKRFSYNLGSNNLSSWSFDNKNILYTTFTRSSVQMTIQPAKRLRSKILTFPPGLQPLVGSWNKDGKSILLTLMKQGNADIFSYNLADAKLERIFSWKSLETSAQMSPDGQKIAFVSDSASARSPQIYIHTISNKKTERVTFRGNYNSSPKWSPNGEKIIYERQEKGIFQIYKYSLLTRRHTKLTFGRFDSEKPDWSPNGKQIVFSSKKKIIPKLYYISAFGGKAIRVTKSPSNISETNPVWSK